MNNEQKIAMKKAYIGALWVMIVIQSMVTIALLFTIILAPAAAITGGITAYTYKMIQKEKEAIAALQSEGVSE